MKNIRRILTLVLVLALVASFALPVLAAGETYTVTITGQKEGHTYEAYQIFAGNLDSTGTILSNITWGDGIDGAAFLAFLTDAARETDLIFSEKRIVDGVETTVKNVFAGCVDADSVSKVLQNYADKDSMLDVFAKYAEDFLTTHQGKSTETTGTTYTITGLPAGYYLIKDKTDSLAADKQDDFYTKFMLEVVGNVPVTVKGSVPTINKTVADTVDGAYGEETSAMIGETVYFELTASLPSNFEIFDDYYFTFIDTMSKGLTFKQIEKVYIQRTGEQVDIDDAFINGGAGKASVTATSVGTDGETTFTVKVGDLKADAFPTLLLENTIVIRYSAIVNENAGIGLANGNLNEVTLKYNNNPYADGEGTTGPDDAIVFTFGMNINKYDKTSPETKLNGAKFVLYRREVYTADVGGVPTEMLKLHFVMVENGKATGWHTVEGITPGASAILTWNSLVADTTKMPAAVLEKITLTTQEIDGVKGKISIAGLDLHTYHILEIEAPDGYNLPHDPFMVKIEPQYDAVTGKFTGMKYEYGSTSLTDVNNDGFAEVDIANGKGNTLPSTGGIGTTIFYVLGSIMALSAVVILVSKKRMVA